VGEDLRDTFEVRKGDHKGRHTTTARELVALPGGGFVVDPPGMRAVGLPVGGGGLDRTFSEIAGEARGCRFRDCRHAGEPGCAVRAAADAGAIDPDRLASYQVLRSELEGVAPAPRPR
jgi:ribosome biogenesis GTPase